jgi:hypothetical protein
MVTLRDIIKTITTAVKTATADSDGQTALDAIESYLDEPSTALADPSSLDRLSSDLKQLYETTILSQKTMAVVSTQSIEASRLHLQHYLFLRCLHALTPLLRPSRIFQDWFPFLKPILMTATYTNNIKKETRLIISDSLITEQEEEEDTAFFDMMVESYLDHTETYQKKQEKEQLDHLEQPVLQQHQVLLDLEQDEWSRNLTTILLSVGSAQTKV